MIQCNVRRFSLRQKRWRNAIAKPLKRKTRFAVRHRSLYFVSFVSVQPWISWRWVGFCRWSEPKNKKKKRVKTYKKNFTFHWHKAQDVKQGKKREEKSKLDPVIWFRFFGSRRSERNKSVKYTTRVEILWEFNEIRDWKQEEKRNSRKKSDNGSRWIYIANPVRENLCTWKIDGIIRASSSLVVVISISVITTRKKSQYRVPVNMSRMPNLQA